MESIIFTKGDYVDLLANGQVIGLGKVECTEVGYGGGRVVAGYVMVLIIDVTQPHLIVEYIDEGDTNPWRTIDLRHTIGKSNTKAHCVKIYS